MSLGILARMPSTGPLPRHAALATAVALSLVGILAACDSSSTTPTAAPSVTAPTTCGADQVADGGLNGKVVDPDGNALGDILIIIETGDGFRGDVHTTEDGVFTATGVSGDFTITTVDGDYIELVQRVTVPCGEQVDLELVLTPRVQ